MDGPALEIRGLTVDYGSTRAVHDVDLRIADGEFVVLLGPNGAGKTSMLHAVAGLARARSTEISIAGQQLTKHSPAARARMGVALVPEGRGLLPGLTVLDNLSLGLRLGRLSGRPQGRWTLEGLLDMFPTLASRMDQDCASLSGGEMQMLAIARALAARPRVILLDEPSLGLAPKIVSDVHTLLAELNRSGTTILLVEQKALSKGVVPDATYLMQRGRIVDRYTTDLPPQEVLAALYLGAS